MRVIVLAVGLLTFASGIVAMYESRLGLSPWDVLHQGLARHTPLTFGEANIAVSVVIVVLVWRLRGPIGPATVCNALSVGLFVQLLTGVPWIAALAHAALPTRWAVLASGLLLIGAGTALYIGAGLGAGPRDSLMVIGAQRTRFRIGVVRMTLELSVLAIGIALGGTVGIGTLAFALTIGPLVELSFWLLARSPLALAESQPTVPELSPQRVYERV